MKKWQAILLAIILMTCFRYCRTGSVIPKAATQNRPKNSVQTQVKTSAPVKNLTAENNSIVSQKTDRTAAKTYYVEEAGLTVEFPSNYRLMDKNSPKKDLSLLPPKTFEMVKLQDGSGYIGGAIVYAVETRAEVPIFGLVIGMIKGEDIREAWDEKNLREYRKKEDTKNYNAQREINGVRYDVEKLTLPQNIHQLRYSTLKNGVGLSFNATAKNDTTPFKLLQELLEEVVRTATYENRTK